MPAPAYKSFRLHINRVVDGYFTYGATVTEWMMWDSEDAANRASDFLHTGTASALYSEGSNTPANARDGSTTSHWSSRAQWDPETWLRVDLATAKVPRRMAISSLQSNGSSIRGFTLQGSNDDGATWEDIAVFPDFLAAMGTRTVVLTRTFGGRALLADGQAASRISIHRWDTLQLVDTIYPSVDGSWKWFAPEKTDYLVTFFGPPGYRPIAEGPVAAPLIEG